MLRLVLYHRLTLAVDRFGILKNRLSGKERSRKLPASLHCIMVAYDPIRMMQNEVFKGSNKTLDPKNHGVAFKADRERCDIDCFLSILKHIIGFVGS